MVRLYGQQTRYRAKNSSDFSNWGKVSLTDKSETMSTGDKGSQPWAERFLELTLLKIRFGELGLYGSP
jgi:hypothetical protein